MGNSLAVQWLDSTLSLPRALVQFLVEELRSHKPFSTAKGKPKKRWPSLDNCSKEPPIIESDDSF